MRIPNFKLSNLLTVGFRLVVVGCAMFFIALAAQRVWSAEVINAGPGPFNDFKKENCAGLTTDACIQLYNSLGSAGSSGGSTCDQSKKELSTAAAKAPVSRESLETAIMCQKCTGSNSPNFCPSVGVVSSRSSSLTRRSSYAAAQSNSDDEMISAHEVKNIAACPMIANKYEEKLKDEVDRRKEEIDKLKGDIETTEQEINESNNRVKEAENKYKNEELPRIKEEVDAKLEALKDWTDEQKDKLAEISKNIKSEVDELTRAAEGLRLQHERALRELDNNCQNEARQRILSEMAVERQKFEKNELKLSSLNDHFNAAGTAKSTQNKKRAEQYYALCLQRNNANKNALREEYATQVSQIQQQIQQKNQELLTEAMKLGGAEMKAKYDKEFEKIKAYQKSQEEKTYAEYQKVLSTEDELLNGPVQTRQQIQQQQMLNPGAIAKGGGLNGKLARLKFELQHAEDILENNINVLRIASQTSANNPSGASSDSSSDLLDNFASLNAAASSVLGDCHCSDPENASKEECKKAMKLFCNTDISEGESECTIPSQHTITNMRKPSSRSRTSKYGSGSQR